MAVRGQLGKKNLKNFTAEANWTVGTGKKKFCGMRSIIKISGGSFSHKLYMYFNLIINMYYVEAILKQNVIENTSPF